MTRDKINYSHGDAGSKPADGNEFASGERPDAQTFDWFWNRVTNVINTIWDEFDRLDSDNDGVVDEADTANLYKGNDIDSNGDGTVDSAEDATNVTSTYKGNDIDTDGDGKVNSAESADDATNVTSTYKGNDIDTDGDGRVDEADTSNLYKGNDIDGDGDGIVDNSDKVNGHAVYVSSTAPSNPETNDLWVDTS